ncbi:MAG: cold shock domain-containing protein [Gallionellaceae bacterium]
MFQGIVKWVNAATGFGCISVAEGGADLFVSLSSVPIALKEGQIVCFEIKNDDSLVSG